MTGVGIIGMGKMGRIRAEALAKSGRAKVVAYFEPNPAAVLEGADRKVSAEAVINDPRVEAVFICTPNLHNQPLTLQALAAKKHVFCEKPPAFTAAQIEEVMAEEKRTGLKVMYGFNHRHHESVLQAKKLVDSGTYGRILWMRGRYGKSVDANFFNDWRSKKEIAGGGIMIDQGIHMLDLFLMFADDFDEVMAAVSNLYWHLPVEDNVFAIFRRKDGLVASLHSTMSQWRHLFSLEIFLEKGYLVINGLLTSSGTYGEEVLTYARNRTTTPAATWSDEEHITYSTNNSWRYEVDQFIDAVSGAAPVKTGTTADAFRLMRIIDRIYASGTMPPGNPPTMNEDTLALP